MTERTSVLAFWKNYDRQVYLRAAELADDLGYDTFWLPEAWGYEVFSLLTEIACRTKHIKIGTAIVNVFSRSPGLLAMHAATLDEISEGRFVLGLGTSGVRVIEGFHGRAYKRPLTQVKDVIRVVRALLAGESLATAGAELHEYRPFRLEMTPARSTIPIYMASLKQKAIEAIGEYADGWMPTFWPAHKLHVGREWIAAGAARAGRDPAAVETAPFTTVLPMPGDSGKQMAKQLIGFYIGGMGDYYKALISGFGHAETCAEVERLYRDKATRQQAYDAVSDALVDELTIAGEPDYCVAELRRRREEYGIGQSILNLPTGMPGEVVEQYIRLMAPGS